MQSYERLYISSIDFINKGISYWRRKTGKLCMYQFINIFTLFLELPCICVRVTFIDDLFAFVLVIIMRITTGMFRLVEAKSTV